MSRVLLLTARDPIAEGDGFPPARTARDLRPDHEVTLVLLEDAVTAARTGHAVGPDLQAAVAAGVTVLAEDEALARRAVATVADGVKPVALGAVVDLLVEGSDRQAWL